jgi:hypothetical protein
MKAKKKSNPNHGRLMEDQSVNSPNGNLERRLESEVPADEKWVAAMRTQASESYWQRTERLTSFVAAATQIDNLLQDKIAVLKALKVFKDIVRTEKLECTDLPAGLYTSKLISLQVPHSSSCPAKVELTFDIRHDRTIENAFVDYKLQIIPEFFKFDSGKQITIPFEEAKGKTICDWIDDSMVDCSKAFFQIRLHEQYRKNQLVTDPVTNIQFPQALAFGSTKQQGKTMHFLTRESMLEFENGPLNFRTPATRIGANANHCI